MSPAYASKLAKIQSTNSAPPDTAAGAHHWRLQLLEFPSTQLGYGEIVRIGDGAAPQTLLSQVPLRNRTGPPLHPRQPAVRPEARRRAERCQRDDSQLLHLGHQGRRGRYAGSWRDGTDPAPSRSKTTISKVRARISCIGGSDPSIAGLVTEHVVVRYNYVTKPMSWQDAIIPTPDSVSASAVAGGGTLPAGAYSYRVFARRQVGGGTWGTSAPSSLVTATAGNQGAVAISWTAVPDATEYRVYGRNQFWTVSRTSLVDTGAAGTAAAMPTGAGTTWQVKNLLELKNARHVTIEYNVFENNWVQRAEGICDPVHPAEPGWQLSMVRRLGRDLSVQRGTQRGRRRQRARIRLSERECADHHGGDPEQPVPRDHEDARIGLVPAHRRRTSRRDVDHNTIDFDGTTAVYAYGGTDTAPRQIAGFRFVNNALPTVSTASTARELPSATPRSRRISREPSCRETGSRVGPRHGIPRGTSSAAHSRRRS